MGRPFGSSSGLPELCGRRGGVGRDIGRSGRGAATLLAAELGLVCGKALLEATSVGRFAEPLQSAPTAFSRRSDRRSASSLVIAQ